MNAARHQYGNACDEYLPEAITLTALCRVASAQALRVYDAGADATTEDHSGLWELLRVVTRDMKRFCDRPEEAGGQYRLKEKQPATA